MKTKRDIVEKELLKWLKSGNENTTECAHRIVMALKIADYPYCHRPDGVVCKYIGIHCHISECKNWY